MGTLFEDFSGRTGLVLWPLLHFGSWRVKKCVSFPERDPGQSDMTMLNVSVRSMTRNDTFRWFHENIIKLTVLSEKAVICHHIWWIPCKMDPEGGHGVPTGSAPLSPYPITRVPTTPAPTPGVLVSGACHGPTQQRRVHQAPFGFNTVAKLTVRADSGATVVTTVVSAVVSQWWFRQNSGFFNRV